jgi:hypothetical protein
VPPKWVYTWLKVGSVKAASSRPFHQRVTQTVETVEKVPFQKLMFEKWDRNIEKRLVFLCSNKILAIFERVVGDFLRELSKRGVFRQSR